MVKSSVITHLILSDYSFDLRYPYVSYGKLKLIPFNLHLFFYSKNSIYVTGPTDSNGNDQCI